MKASVQQAVHGYSHGHTELSASVKLDASDADAVTRLSDLSGALVHDRDFGSYLTFYPLPSDTYYVVARTWLDEDAPRAGCVLTHSLLIPIDEWGDIAEPHALARFLRRPSRQTLNEFNVPVAATAGDVGPKLPLVHGEDVDEFCSRYFGEGLQPLVWFDSKNPDALSWKLVRSLWPSMRRRFSCCTYALKPRALDDRPFDLLFAPQQAQSRFAEYSRDHVVQGSHLNSGSHEAWITNWAAAVFGDGLRVGSDATLDDVKRLSNGLEANPTAIRRVFLYLELNARAASTPMAVVGALDVLDTLNMPDKQAVADAKRLTLMAVQAAAQLQAEDSLELLYLLAERIATLNDSAIESVVSEAIRNLIVPMPDLFLAAENLVSRRSGGAPVAFLAGVAASLPQDRNDDSGAVRQVLDCHVLGPLLALNTPSALEGLVRAGRSRQIDAVVPTLVQWCSTVLEPAARRNLRTRILPALIPAELPLGRELLRDATAEEMSDLCALISRSPNAMDSSAAWNYAEAVRDVAIGEVNRWARAEPIDTFFDAYALALTLTLDESSLDCAIENATGNLKALALTVFVERALRDSPNWAQSRVGDDKALWTSILSLSSDSIADDWLERVCRRAHRTAIARVPDSAQRLRGRSATIQDHAIAQWVRDWIDTGADESDPEKWLGEEWVRSSLLKDASAVTGYLLRRSDWQFDSWLRGWRLLAELPVGASWLSTAPDVIDSLIRRRLHWTDDVVRHWRQVIESLSGQGRPHLDMCTRSLRYCFDHPQDPLAPVVAVAFFPVHAAALEEKASSSWGLFSFLEWDRGLELRRQLVDAFSRGPWQPEYFVLAAQQPWLLRKLCRRMLRQWGGRNLLERAHHALANKSVEHGDALIDTLKDVLENSEFHEPWD